MNEAVEYLKNHLENTFNAHVTFDDVHLTVFLRFENVFTNTFTVYYEIKDYSKIIEMYKYREYENFKPYKEIEDIIKYELKKELNRRILK